MSGFFRPPPSSGAELATGGNPPRWTGRLQGSPPGEVVNDVMLARSDSAAVYIAYVDAYPEGFEFDVKAITVAAEHEFRREGEEHGPDIFGRHWPMVGERQDAIPPQLLRIGVQFADGRGATNIIGHDQPADGPILWPLRGGGGGGRFHQGYWVSPLPTSGPVALVCEWPAAGIPLIRHELDAQLFLDGAGRARALFPDGRECSGTAASGASGRMPMSRGSMTGHPPARPSRPRSRRSSPPTARWSCPERRGRAEAARAGRD